MPKHQPGGLGFSVGVFLNLSSQKFRLCESTEFSLLATSAQLLAATSIAKDYEPLRQSHVEVSTVCLLFGHLKNTASQFNFFVKFQVILKGLTLLVYVSFDT